MREAREGVRPVSPAARHGAAMAGAVLAAALAISDPARGRPADANASLREETAVGVIVRERTSASPAAERLVRRLRGRVVRQLPIVGGFAARVAPGAIAELQRSQHVAALWRDGRVTMADDDDDDDDGDDGDDDGRQYDPAGSNRIWRDAVGLAGAVTRYDGEDVGVAVLDTGVSSASDLSRRVAARVEFTPGADGLDRVGHGTHVAGIIAGSGRSSGGRWRGVAPDAEVISIKVAGPDGSTDVSVVLAALQWVVANRDRFDIRVLNLSFGTDATQSYLVDPLNYAVEQVWRAGILVVVAAGNDGPAPGSVAKPGDDPFVLTVGAADVRDTATRADDVVAPFSARGPTVDGIAKPDLVAPGVGIVSVRAVGSAVDLIRPEARVRTSYFRGSGTSQAAALVSGIAALLFDADPRLTPDEAKAALMATSSGLEDDPAAGRGLVHAGLALEAVQTGRYEGAAPNPAYAPSDGRGSIEQSRGTHHVYSDPDGDGVPALVEGERDVLGNPWDSTTWTTAGWTSLGWASSPWSGLAAAAESFRQMGRPRSTWSGTVWDAGAWSAKYWRDSGWAAKYWKNWAAKYWRTFAWE